MTFAREPCPADCPLWYALTVRPRHEQQAAEQLERRGFAAFSPCAPQRMRWSDRVKLVKAPLFPRYVFARFPLSERRTAVMTPGVLSLVTFGPEIVPVEDSDIAGIRRLLELGLPLTPAERLAPGARVRIVAGPLEGLEGIVQKMRSFTRLVIQMEMLGRGVSTEIDRDIVLPVQHI